MAPDSAASLPGPDPIGPIATPPGAGAAPSAVPPEPARIGLPLLCAAAILVGVITGFGAVAFRDLIGLIHNLFFLGRLRLEYGSSVFTPASPFGPAIILAPVLGGLVVTWLVSNFAPEAKGHGVPEVMDAVFYGRGVIRPAVAVVKSLASAMAIGSGAAVGREGPIIQIGAALGSTFGQIMPMRAGQRIVLVASGAGAGIAATFNTPIGGVLFATELMLPEVSVNTFLPVALATGTATFVGRLFFGAEPAFAVPADLTPFANQPSAISALLLYAILGAIAGIAAAGFIRTLHVFEDAFDRIGGRYRRHALGMLGVGVLFYALHLFAGHYYVEGVGYATIQSVLVQQPYSAGFLLLLFVAKLAATCASLGSGSSGGVFSPSLFMGTTLGAAFGALVLAADPSAPVDLPSFAMVGMGAMVGGGTGAAMTAVTMIFEMTRDYNIVLPMIIAVAVALGTRRMLSRENIYTIKLVRRGHPIPKALHANMYLVRTVGELMEREVLVLDRSTPVATLRDPGAGASPGRRRLVVLTEGGRAAGVLRFDPTLAAALSLVGVGAGAAASGPVLGDVAVAGFVIVRELDIAFDIVALMDAADADNAIVLGNVQDEGGSERIVGVLSRDQIADAAAGGIRLS